MSKSVSIILAFLIANAFQIGNAWPGTVQHNYTDDQRLKDSAKKADNLIANNHSAQGLSSSLRFYARSKKDSDVIVGLIIRPIKSGGDYIEDSRFPRTWRPGIYIMHWEKMPFRFVTANQKTCETRIIKYRISRSLLESNGCVD